MNQVVGRIYALVDKEFEIVYIGQTVQLLRKRWYNHKSKCKTSTNKKDNWLRKHINEAKIVELCVCYSFEEMDEIERSLISIIGLENLLNQESGGSKNKKHSPESKAKMSESQKGKIVSDEAKSNMSKAQKNKQDVSEETRAKLRISLTGNTNSLGYKHSDITKEKHRINSLGENNPFYGKKHSPESIAKMCESHKGLLSKKMSIINTVTGEIKYFESNIDCRNYLKLSGIEFKEFKNGKVLRKYKIYEGNL